jgi:hypothetical protein
MGGFLTVGGVSWRHAPRLRSAALPKSKMRLYAYMASFTVILMVHRRIAITLSSKLELRGIFVHMRMWHLPSRRSTAYHVE